MRQRIAIAIALACQPEAPDRRRADDGARRHRAGRDPPAARPPAPRERPLGHPDHPRPRRHVVDRRPRLDLLRRPGRRVGPREDVLRRRGTRTRARCSTRCRIPSSGATSRSSRSRARRRAPAASRRAARSTRAARFARGRLPGARARARSTATAARSPATSTRSQRDERARAPRRRGRLRRGAAAAACAPSRGELCGRPRRRSSASSASRGCGKSTLAARGGRPGPSDVGPIIFEGRELSPLGRRARPRELVRLQIVFQNPYSSLNPRRQGRLAARGRARDARAGPAAASGRACAELLERGRAARQARPTGSRTSSAAASGSASRSPARSPPSPR